MRNASKKRLALTLRFLATGKFLFIEYQFWIISYINDEVCKIIVTVLAGTYLKFPSCQDYWRNIKKKFKKKWNFPHCISATDSKHSEIIGHGIGSQYYNYKGTSSIVLLVPVGSNYG